ncbi:MAG: hypothetical protein JNK05_41650 [Myxococcales bacterium]|nr:hypothetical protein [Myxococcales bacterium]
MIERARRLLVRNAPIAAILAAGCGAPGGIPANPEQRPGDPGGAVAPAPTPAQGATCAPQTADATRYLRQLSLDLRGRPPTVEEIARVEAAGRVPDDLIDAMLRSPEFSQRVKDWHAELLWPTLDGFRISTTDLTAFDPNMTTGAAGGAFSPDPELIDDDGRARHPNGVVAIRYNGTGDRVLRGGNGSTFCDGRLGAPYEYPEPAARGAAQPTYSITTSDGRSTTRPYYDDDGAPLPIYDGEHCPNYCTTIDPSTPAGSARLRVIRPAAAGRGPLCQVVGTGAIGVSSSDFANQVLVGATVTAPGSWTATAPAISAGGCVNPGDVCECPSNPGGAATAGAMPNQFRIDAPPTGWTIAALDRPPTGSGASQRVNTCPPWAPYRVVNTCDNTPFSGPDETFRIRREGTRVVRDWYWSGGRSLRVCAYDASARTNSTRNGQSCETVYSGRRDTSCGCGPRGIYCMPSIGVSQNTDLASRTQSRVRDALNAEPLEIVASVVERDEDYNNIFTTRRSFVNGPLRHLYEHQLTSVQGIELQAPAPMTAMPTVAFSDNAMREFVRGPEHSGVLTTAAYLGRFPTWRARVAQFRIAFMCKAFTPGSDRVPSPTDPCTREPNLASRCGCQNCHAAIEPMTAYFARWAERSTRFLNPLDFPAFDANCAQCALRGVGCTPRCRTQYVTDTVDADGARFAGTLRGFLYRRSDEMSRVDEGPAGLVASATASGELQSCTVRNAWRQLVNRPMTESEMRTLLPSFTASFEQSRHSYRSLVRAIVTSATYRRID